MAAEWAALLFRTVSKLAMVALALALAALAAASSPGGGSAAGASPARCAAHASLVAAPARWQCELSGIDSDAARGGRRWRWRSYNNHTTSGRARAYGGQAARKTFAYFGWEETRGDDWDLLWTGRGQYDFMRQAGLRNPPPLDQPGRRHNHCFPSGLIAGNKQSLVKRHNTMVDLYGSKDFAVCIFIRKSTSFACTHCNKIIIFSIEVHDFSAPTRDFRFDYTIPRVKCKIPRF